MPAAPLIVVKADSPYTKDLPAAIQKKLIELPPEKEGVRLVHPATVSQMAELKLPDDAVQAARLLYSELRRLAETGPDVIVFREKELHARPEWQAVFDRLTRAASLTV
jgi:hypothetical protein